MYNNVLNLFIHIQWNIYNIQQKTLLKLILISSQSRNIIFMVSLSVKTHQHLQKDVVF